MPLTLRALNAFTILVTGMDLDAMPRGDWRVMLDDLGNLVQDYIAEQWDEGRTGSNRPLRANSPQYTAYKRARGLSTERGERTGKLLNAIAGARLFIVGAVASNGHATITFLEPRLEARVRQRGESYVPHYVAAKVPVVKRVLQFNQATLQVAGRDWLLRNRLAKKMGKRG
jgi:hypothetical protein